MDEINTPDEMIQELEESEEIKDFEDVKNGYVFAHRRGSEYTYDTEDQALRAKGLALLNRFNEWVMDFVAFGLEKEEFLKQQRIDAEDALAEPTPDATTSE